MEPAIDTIKITIIITIIILIIQNRSSSNNSNNSNNNNNNNSLKTGAPGFQDEFFGAAAGPGRRPRIRRSKPIRLDRHAAGRSNEYNSNNKKIKTTIIMITIILVILTI